MAACELQDLDDEEFNRLVQSRNNETSVKTVNNAPPLPDGMRYHIFISHSNKTEEETNWAKDVVKTLEEDYGLKCLLPSRDFVAGHDILSQITDGIVKSAKLVCVFTRDSLESDLCEYERKLALNLSLNMDRAKIIPLLLKECDIPDMFRFMNYIDVLKGEDYIQRIIGSFYDNDVPNMERVVQEIVEPSRKRFEERNRDRLSGIQCRLYGDKTRFRGAAWSFKHVQVYKGNVLGKLKNRFSEQLYTTARGIVNRSWHLRYYSFTSDVRRAPIIFLLLTLAIALPVILAILVVEKTHQVLVISETFDFEQIMVLGYIFTPCGLVVLFVMVLFHISAFRSLKAEIHDLCLQQVMDSNILVKYGVGNGSCQICGSPCVTVAKELSVGKNVTSYWTSLGRCVTIQEFQNIKLLNIEDPHQQKRLFPFGKGTQQIEFMIYDIQPCLIYMTEVYVSRAQQEVTDELKRQMRKTAERQILFYLNHNIDAIFQWSSLPTSTVHRHPTSQSKACLCETLLATNVS